MTDEVAKSYHLKNDGFTRDFLEWIASASVPMLIETLIGIPDYPHDTDTRYAMIAEISELVSVWSNEEREIIKNIIINNHNNELFLARKRIWNMKN